jgi:hypothetical protein
VVEVNRDHGSAGVSALLKRHARHVHLEVQVAPAIATFKCSLALSGRLSALMAIPPA